MTNGRPGRSWLRGMAKRVASLDGAAPEDAAGDDAPMPFGDFDDMLTRTCGSVQKRGNERSQGPDCAIARAIGRRQLVKWFQAHHMSVQHDAEAPRTVRLAISFGMGDTRHKHVWVDERALRAWTDGGAGAGMGVDPVEFDCRRLTLDEIMVLTVMLDRHMSVTSAQWNFRCTPQRLVEVVAAKTKPGPEANPYIGYHGPDVSTMEAIKRDLSPDLRTRAQRVIGLFENASGRRS